jgi:pyruvate,water dikinase
MEHVQGISLPEVIYGDQPPPIESLKAELGDTFKGIPTSRGYYEGSVRVIQSLEQTEKLLEGDILVIPFSDVAWTPLFSRAGAVIAESGGILSHSSIVARELGIPCVVSVPDACLIPDGTKVIIDGFQGEILILES